MTGLPPLSSSQSVRAADVARGLAADGPASAWQVTEATDERLVIGRLLSASSGQARALVALTVGVPLALFGALAVALVEADLTRDDLLVLAALGVLCVGTAWLLVRVVRDQVGGSTAVVFDRTRRAVYTMRDGEVWAVPWELAEVRRRGGGLAWTLFDASGTGHDVHTKTSASPRYHSHVADVADASLLTLLTSFMDDGLDAVHDRLPEAVIRDEETIHSPVEGDVLDGLLIALRSSPQLETE